MPRLIIITCLIATSVACVKKTNVLQPGNEPPTNVTIEGLSDTSATLETKALYAYLKNLMGKNILFGQQFSTYYRQGGTDDFCNQNISDCYTTVGDHPAMLGVNYTVDTAILRAHIINAYAHGGIVTVHWTMRNPVTGKDVHDTTPAVYAIIQGGTKYDFYKDVLKTLAAYFKSLKDKDGKVIPIIFRPFHENSDDGKWWGKPYCTPAEYIQLYRQTVSYLRDTMQVHNVIYAYAPSDPASKTDEAYSVRYPGDDCVDIIGFDKYGGDNSNYANVMVQNCRLVVNLARASNKVAAITETGIGNGIQNATSNDYFMRYLLLPILADPRKKRCFTK